MKAAVFILVGLLVVAGAAWFFLRLRRTAPRGAVSAKSLLGALVPRDTVVAGPPGAPVLGPGGFVGDRSTWRGTPTTPMAPLGTPVLLA